MFFDPFDLDFLLFEAHDRNLGDDLVLQLAISEIPEEEQLVINEVVESLIIKYQIRRWDSVKTAVN